MGTPDQYPVFNFNRAIQKLHTGHWQLIVSLFVLTFSLKSLATDRCLIQDQTTFIRSLVYNEERARNYFKHRDVSDLVSHEVKAHYFDKTTYAKTSKDGEMFLYFVDHSQPPQILVSDQINLKLDHKDFLLIENPKTNSVHFIKEWGTLKYQNNSFIHEAKSKIHLDPKEAKQFLEVMETEIKKNNPGYVGKVARKGSTTHSRDRVFECQEIFSKRNQKKAFIRDAILSPIYVTATAIIVNELFLRNNPEKTNLTEKAMQLLKEKKFKELYELPASEALTQPKEKPDGSLEARRINITLGDLTKSIVMGLGTGLTTYKSVIGGKTSWASDALMRMGMDWAGNKFINAPLYEGVSGDVQAGNDIFMFDMAFSAGRSFMKVGVDRFAYRKLPELLFNKCLQNPKWRWVGPRMIRFFDRFSSGIGYLALRNNFQDEISRGSQVTQEAADDLIDYFITRSQDEELEKQAKQPQRKKEKIDDLTQ